MSASTKRVAGGMNLQMTRAAAALAPHVGRGAAIVIVFVLKNGPVKQSTVEASLMWTKSTTSKAVVAAKKHDLLDQEPGMADGVGAPSPLLVVPQNARHKLAAWASDAAREAGALHEMTKRRPIGN